MTGDSATSEIQGSAPGITWRWPLVPFAAVCAVPPALVTLSDPSRGLAMAFGVFPAVLLGVRGPRRSRVAVLVIGTMIGLSLTIGAVLARSPILAVVGIVVLGIGSAVLASRHRLGQLAMTLAVPLVGAGLSFPDVRSAAELGLLMVLGSAYGWLVTLLWPERTAAIPPPRPTPSTADMLKYGIRLGLAGGLCAAIGFALDLDHPGWATAACLLVMRPSAQMTSLRGAGRAVAVTVGALAATLVAVAELDAVAIGVLVLVDLVALAATRPSRWYVTGAFTTFIVILLIVYGAPGQAGSRFVERALETLLGVGVALVFGSVLVNRRAARSASS